LVRLLVGAVLLLGQLDCQHLKYHCWCWCWMVALPRRRCWYSGAAVPLVTSGWWQI
jgi:hypothetical protein